MSRQHCLICERPLPACICKFFTPIENKTQVIVLQHPSEVKQSKGTVTLLVNSLKNCKVIVGENFSQNNTLLEILSLFKGDVALLYPSEHARTIDESKVFSGDINKPKCLLVLDGTWKKAYRLYMLNPFLHNIPHLTLPASIEGEYVIRKTKKAQALSTLEACAHALSLLEQSPAKYKALIDNFIKFNQFQLSFTKKASD